MPNTKPRHFNFQPEWILNYGLEVCTQDLSTRNVTSVLCMFYTHAKQKQKCTANVEYFSYPWQSDNFSKHMKQQNGHMIF